MCVRLNYVTFYRYLVLWLDGFDYRAKIGHTTQTRRQSQGEELESQGQ